MLFVSESFNSSLFLINSFFKAVNNENDINSALSGSITNFINRFAISVFEEGAFIHVSTETQTLVVELAISILTYRNDKKWMKCAKTMNKIVFDKHLKATGPTLITGPLDMPEEKKKAENLKKESK